MKESNADLFMDVFCPLLSLDEQLCSLFRFPSLSMLLGSDGGVPAASCPTSAYGSFFSSRLQEAAAASTSSPSSSPDPSPPLTAVPVTVFFSCVSSGPCTCVVTVVGTVLGIYLLLAVLVNLVACYNFVVAWNLIARMYHVDLTFVSGPRSSLSRSSPQSSSDPTRRGAQHRSGGGGADSNSSSDDDDALRRHTCSSTSQLVDAASMRDTCCPVCLEEFYEMERVSSCEDGCGAWFHKACLTEWLDRSDSCPCCRRDMVAAPRLQSRGCWHDLTVFLGYAPAR